MKATLVSSGVFSEDETDELEDEEVSFEVSPSSSAHESVSSSSSSSPSASASSSLSEPLKPSCQAIDSRSALVLWRTSSMPTCESSTDFSCPCTAAEVVAVAAVVGRTEGVEKLRILMTPDMLVRWKEVNWIRVRTDFGLHAYPRRSSRRETTRELDAISA